MKDESPALTAPTTAEPRSFRGAKPAKEAAPAAVAPQAAPVAADPAAAARANANRPIRTPDEWAQASGRTRVSKVAVAVNGVAQKDRTLSGEHTAAARLHRWGRSDVTPRLISREDYEAAIRATKRAPEGSNVPVPHPGALFASIFPER